MEEIKETEEEVIKLELISQETIAEKISQIGMAISEDFKGKDLVLLCVLKGAKPFCTSLTEKLTIPHTVEGIKVSSYEDTQSNGKPTIKLDHELDIDGKDVLVVEDIIDTGHSLAALVNNYIPAKYKPASVSVAVLLDKPDRRVDFSVTPAYTGFIIPNLFVIGFGMDYKERFREDPDISVKVDELTEEVKESVRQHAEEIKAQLNNPVRTKPDIKQKGYTN